MKKKLQRAFTITELVIVIAVIAILAAVLIPTFVNVSNKAKDSADQQAATSMNRVLTSETVLSKPTTPGEVRRILLSGGIQTYTPYAAGTHFGWLEEENVIVIYTVKDGVNKISYPKEYIGSTSMVWNLEADVVTSADQLMSTIAAAEAGSTIQIKESMVIDADDTTYGEIYFTNPVSFDLNGNTLTMDGTYLVLNVQDSESELAENPRIVFENGTIIGNGKNNEYQYDGVMQVWAPTSGSSPNIDIVMNNM